MARGHLPLCSLACVQTRLPNREAERWPMDCSGLMHYHNDSPSSHTSSQPTHRSYTQIPSPPSHSYSPPPDTHPSSDTHAHNQISQPHKSLARGAQGAHLGRHPAAEASVNIRPRQCLQSVWDGLKQEHPAPPLHTQITLLTACCYCCSGSEETGRHSGQPGCTRMPSFSRRQCCHAVVGTLGTPKAIHMAFAQDSPPHACCAPQREAQ